MYKSEWSITKGYTTFFYWDFLYWNFFYCVIMYSLHLFIWNIHRSLSEGGFWAAFPISFIPGAITTLVFFITQKKASRYYLLYLWVAFFTPFLIPIIVGLSLHFFYLNWYSVIDPIIGAYALLFLPCVIFGIVQLLWE